MPATILLVEDNPLARRNMTIFFKIHGYDVFEAQRGEEALELIRDVDNFDVVITDLRMPGWSMGWRFFGFKTKYLHVRKLFW
jgi:CheY-like chemotaxis protein